MKAKKNGLVGKSGANRMVHEAEGAASGAVVGAVVGAMAGPPGIAAGAAIGAVAGAVAAAALDADAANKAAHEREVDAEIGVGGGELGAPNLKHPPAVVGAYSGTSMGADTSSGSDLAEGPLSTPDE